jgi:hypothetical protein
MMEERMKTGYENLTEKELYLAMNIELEEHAETFRCEPLFYILAEQALRIQKDRVDEERILKHL